MRISYYRCFGVSVLQKSCFLYSSHSDFVLCCNHSNCSDLRTQIAVSSRPALSVVIFAMTGRAMIANARILSTNILSIHWLQTLAGLEFCWNTMWNVFINLPLLKMQTALLKWKSNQRIRIFLIRLGPLLSMWILLMMFISLIRNL